MKNKKNIIQISSEKILIIFRKTILNFILYKKSYKK